MGGVFAIEPVVVFTDASLRWDYVRVLARIFHERWGLRSVLVFPTSVSGALIAECSAGIGSAGIAARLKADESDLAGLANYLRRHFKVVAVVPQAEYQVGVASRLTDLLGIDWIPSTIISRFRDKQALKEHLRRQPDAPRINLSRCVSSVDDVMDCIAGWNIPRFVLKPNDGAGNSRIAFFDAPLDEVALRRYFESAHGTQILLEEFIEGPEYCVSGQVDERGQVRVFAVQLATHQLGNGRTNLAGGFRMLQTDTREFRLGAEYAVRVLTASGLKRSPFHLDIKIDDVGPSLIEAGARLAGAGIPRDTELAHGGTLDPFLEAARCYLPDTPGQPADPNWLAYDRAHVTTVVGLAQRSEQIAQLWGVKAVEALPQFAYWIMRPQRGQRVQRTVDLVTAPWQVTLQGDSAAGLPSLEEEVRAMIGWQAASTPGQALLARASWARRRIPAVVYLASRRPRRVA